MRNSCSFSVKAFVDTIRIEKMLNIAVGIANHFDRFVVTVTSASNNERIIYPPRDEASPIVHFHPTGSAIVIAG
jgi:hypothetical protein